MSIRAYLRGIGIGMLVTAIILTVSHINSRAGSLDNEEIKNRARALGMMEANEVLLSEAETLAGQSAGQGDNAEETAANQALEAGATKELDSGGPAESDQAETNESDASKANPFDSADTDGGKEEEDRMATAGGGKAPEAEVTPAAGAGAETEPSSSTGNTAKPGDAGNGSSEPSDAIESSDNKKADAGSKDSSKTDNSSAESAKTDEGSAESVKTDSSSAESAKTDEGSAESAKTDNGSAQGASFHIGSGLGSMDIAKQLQSAGYVSDAAAFDAFLCSNGYDRKIRSGDHFIPKGASEQDIAKIITRS